MPRSQNRTRLIVKIAVAAVIVILVLVLALDAISVFRAKSHLSKVADTAATAAAAAYHQDHNTAQACDAASAALKAADVTIVPGKHFCRIDAAAGSVRISLHEQAGTILVGHIPFVRRVTVIGGHGSSG